MMSGVADAAGPARLVDLERYPLFDPEALAPVLEGARAGMVEVGTAELAGFVRPEAMEELLADARALAPLAWRSAGDGSAYLAPPPDDLPDAHPRRWLGPRSLGAVAYDLFPASSPLRELYEWDVLKDFVGAIVRLGEIYRYADTCGALNLAVMTEGDELQWHYDQTDFVVSLALQDSEAGGDFEVVPNLRSADDEHYPEVAKVLAGDRARVVTLDMTPGTLLVFDGRCSLHRVSPVIGPVDRYVGLLSYDTRPGTVSSEHLRRVRYGREPAGAG